MKFLILTSIALVGTMLSRVQAETLHSEDGFETTSGNIECIQETAVQNNGSALVMCIRHKPSVLTATIENGKVKVTTAVFSIDVEDVPVLADGGSNIIAGSTCSVARDGVTCKSQGIGFKISRRGVKVLK